MSISTADIQSIESNTLLSLSKRLIDANVLSVLLNQFSELLAMLTQYTRSYTQGVSFWYHFVTGENK